MTTPGIEALTVPALSLALDAAVIRQHVTANNIANAHTEGFQARRVRFDAFVGDSSEASGGTPLEMQMRLEPQMSLSVDGSVRLDGEVAAMAQNGTHYQALLKALNRHLSVLATAVSEGKR